MYILTQFIAALISAAIVYLAHLQLPQLQNHSQQLPVLFLSLLLAACLAVTLGAALGRLGKRKRSRRRVGQPVEGGKRSGTIKWFNTKKQYGFITTDDGEDIFVHKRFINGDRRKKIREGMSVTFSVSKTDKGLQAEDVDILE